MLFVLLETSHHTADCGARQSGGDNSWGGSKDPRGTVTPDLAKLLHPTLAM